MAKESLSPLLNRLQLLLSFKSWAFSSVREVGLPRCCRLRCRPFLLASALLSSAMVLEELLLQESRQSLLLLEERLVLAFQLISALFGLYELAEQILWLAQFSVY